MEFDPIDELVIGDQIDVLVNTVWWSGVFGGKSDLSFSLETAGSTKYFRRDEVITVRKVENEHLEPLDAVYVNLRTMIREMETL